MLSASRAASRSPGSLAFAIALALLVGGFVLAPLAQASPTVAPSPADVLSITLLLDKSSYVSGDNATATVVVYRTPGPANYTYTWRVEDFFGGTLATLANGTSSYTYMIPLTYEGILRFRVTVDDDTGLSQAAARTANVAAGYLGLTLDRSEFAPGERISAFYSVSSHVITQPSYAYSVVDVEGTTVLSGTTNNTFFSFTTPNPSSRGYTFSVTASQAGRFASGSLTIFQAGGYVLSISLDKTSYLPGDTIHAHLTVSARGTASLPSQFRFTMSLFGVTSASAISTFPGADLYLAIPAGVSNGDLLVAANELNTGASGFQTVHVGAENGFWSAEVGGVPVVAALLGVLVVILLIAVLVLWRRSMGGGPLTGRGTPPPPEGPTRAPASSPMSIACRRCGKPIDLTTSKRPIEVMCPSCGEPQMVT